MGASRVRVATGAAALVVTGALAIVPAALEDERAEWLWPLAVIGVIATGLAILRWTGALWWGVVALGAEYAVLRVGRGPVDLGAVFVATGLILLAELVLWSLDARSPVDDAAVTGRRLRTLGLLTLGTSVLGSLLVSAGRFRGGHGLALTLVGVAAAIGIAVVLAWASAAPGRDHPSRSPSGV
jgi:hypothetical protein